MATMIQNELTGLVRDALADHPNVREIRMFCGVSFMLDGNMAVGVSPRGLMVRVGKERHDDAASRPGAASMEMRGRPMLGYVIVDGDGLDARSVGDWVALGRGYVATLPPKASRSTPKRQRKD